VHENVEKSYPKKMKRKENVEKQSSMAQVDLPFSLSRLLS
jgi:hypothetical protein